MAVKLTAPIERTSAAFKGITRIVIEIPHKLNQAQTDMVIDKAKVSLVYETATFALPDEVIGRGSRTLAINAWPQSLKTDAKQLYEELEAYAQTIGDIAGGIAEPLE